MNKRILSLGLISAVAFGLVSCEKVEFQQESSTIGDNFGFIAEISEESRTTNNNSYQTAWENGDEMEVYYYSSGTKHCTFKYNEWIFTPESSGLSTTSQMTWVGVYPKTNSVSLSGSGSSSTIKVTLTVPDTFRQAGNNSMSHLAGEDGLPMYGSVTGKLAAEPKMKMSMKQMAAVIKFNITNDYEKAVTISRIEFEAADDNLVGPFTGTLSSGAVSKWSAGTGAAKKVTLNVQEGSPVANGSSAAFYVGTAPFSHSNNKYNYTLTVYGTDSGGQELKATKTVSLTMTLASAKVKTINYTFPADATPIVKKTYTKVSENSGTLEAGTYLIVNKINERALSGTTDGNTNYIAVSPSEDDVITGDYSENEMTISVSGSYYTIQNASGYYLFADNSNSTTYIGYQLGANNFTLEKLSDYADRFYFKTSRGDQDSEYLYYNSGGYFKIGGSGAPKDTNPDSGVYLYKYNDPRTPQILSFSGADDAQIDLANENKTFKATLEGAYTDVTYTSSDESVATVASDGTVTAVAKGTTVITATAAASDQYQKGRASYTLTIINSAIVLTKFYKVTSVEVGKEYVIVSNGHALKNNNGAVAAEEVTDVAGVIELEDYDALVWTVGTPSYTGTDYPGYTYTNGGKKLNRNSQNIQLSNASSDKYYNFDYKEDGNTGNYTFRCGTYYYTGYDGGWKAPTSKIYVALYCSEKPKADRGLQFAESSVSKNLGAEAFINTLTGYTDGVTFTSTNTNVATVNSATGQVTVSSSNAGTTTITASAPETETYRAGSATFTLTVIDPTAITSYKKVSSITSGKSYLVVDKNNGSALMYSSNNSTNNKMGVAPKDGIITAASADTYVNCEFVITADGGNYTFYSEKNKKYLGWVNGSNTYMGFFDSGSTDNPITFTLPEGNEATTEGYLYFKSTKSGTKSSDGSSYNEWLYYKSSSNCFKIGGSGNPEGDGNTDHGVILYEKQ